MLANSTSETALVHLSHHAFGCVAGFLIGPLAICRFIFKRFCPLHGSGAGWRRGLPSLDQVHGEDGTWPVGLSCLHRQDCDTTGIVPDCACRDGCGSWMRRLAVGLQNFYRSTQGGWLIQRKVARIRWDDSIMFLIQFTSVSVLTY